MPDGDGQRRQRLSGARAAVAAVVLLLSTVAFFRVALLPAIGSALVLRPGLLSLMTVVFALGRLFTDLPAGRVSDRVDPLRALAASAVGLALGSVLLAGAHSLAALLVAAAVLGVGSAATNTTGMTYFSRAPIAVRGKSLAVFSGALLGGQSLGPAVAGVLSGPLGWRATEVVAGIAAAAVAGVALLRTGGAGGGARTADRGDAAPPLARPQLLLVYAVSFSVFFALGAMPQTLLPLIGSRDYRLGAGTIGLLLGVGGACRFAGAALGGVVADRVSRKASLVPALLAMGAGASLLAVASGPGVWVASVVLLSLGSFGGTVGATILADLGGGRRVGRRLGGYRFAGDLGLVAGPLAAGWLYDGVGTRAAVGTVGAVLAACAIACALALRETRHAEPAVALELG